MKISSQNTDGPLPKGWGRNRFRILIDICTMIVVGVGLISLLGWALKLSVLASLGSGNIPIAPSSAVMFMLYACAIYLRTHLQKSRVSHWAGVSITAAGALLAALLLVLSLIGIRAEAEHLGFSVINRPGEVHIGHMSPVTAFCFLLSSLSYLLSLSFSRDKRWAANFAWWLACCIIAIGSILALAYLYGTPMLYGSVFIPPAALTSLAFIALGTALLSLAAPHAWPSSSNVESSTRASYSFLLVFVLLAAGIVIAGFLYYRNYELRHRTEEEHDLSAIADLKVEGLVHWQKERLGDAALFYKNLNFSGLVQRYLQRPEDEETAGKLRTWLQHVRDGHQYDRVFLLDAAGTMRMSAPDARRPISSHLVLSAAEVLRTKQVAFKDFYRNEYDGRIYLAVLIPILDERGNGRSVGTLALRMDPEEYLYPFINRWPTPSKTAETLLVRREGNEVLFLNELRFKKNTALNLRISLDQKDSPAAQAALNRKGVMEGRDYRGVPVIADIRPVPDTPWFLVSRMDISEVYEPMREKLWMMVALVGALLLGAGGGVGLVWRRQRTEFFLERYKASEALRASEARLRTLVQTIPDLIWLKDANGVFMACNPMFERLVGAREADILGKTDYDFVSRELADFFREHDRKAMAAGKPTRNEEWITFANDGHRALLETIKTPMYDAAGKVIGVLGIARDITDRTRAEAALRESETQYRSLFENMLEGFAYCKLILAQGKVQDFVHLQVNGAFERLTGLRDVVGKKVSEVIPGMRETNPELFEIFGRVAATGTPERVEAFSEAFGGWLSISVYSTEKEHFVAVFDNITERKKAEEELRFNNAVLAAQQETAIDGILLVDGEGKILNYNTRFVDMWGLVAEVVATGRDEKVMQTVLDKVKHSEEFLKKVKHLYEAPEEKSRDEIALRDGRTFDRYSAPMSSSDGKYYGRIWYFRDITEGKQAEEALRESQQVLEGIINAIPVRVFWKDKNLVYLGSNAAFARDAGFADPKDIIGKDDYQMGWHDQAELYRSDDRQVIESGRSKFFIEEPSTTSEGNIITLLTSKIPLLSFHGEIIGLIGTYMDITELKRAQESLVLSEKKFKDLLETINLISVMLDLNGNITFCNDYLLHLTGWTRDEVLNRNWFDLFLPDQNRETVRSMFISGIAEGTTIPLHYENLIITRDGDKKNIVWDNSLLWDINEKVMGLASIGTDVTEHGRLEAQYLQAQKMESIGTLAGGVAHDFNNILSAIIGYSHVTLMDMAEDSPQRMNIEHILEAADRAARLTKELLLFSRKHITERKPVDLNEVVSTVEKFLRMVIGEDIECRTVLQGRSIPVYADSHQLEQVLMNLATNARDAMPGGGSLTIKTEQIDLAEDFISAHGYGKSGPYGMITVSDTGSGMDEATQKRIFEPFFTTKEVGKGTGLGLAVVYGIIKQHDGFINVYSEPGKGTAFRIYLPIIGERETEGTKAQQLEAPARGTETVLLAEDDENLRKLSRTILKEYGYTVIEAVDGEEAVKKFIENKDAIQLLLFDLIMPKKNGKEASDEIKKIKPDVEVLFASGYDPDLLQQKELLGEGVHLVYKPISPMDLLRKVRSVLDGAT